MTALLPDGSKLLHIGMPKTGTTGLQHALWNARDELEALGVHNVAHDTHEREVGLTAAGSTREAYRKRPARWRQLATEFRTSTSRRTVWSSEALSLAGPERIEQLREELGPVHVVTTVRALAPQLASRWQQGVRRGARIPLTPWLQQQLAAAPGAPVAAHHQRGASLQRIDPRRVLRDWGRVFGEENLTFIVLDPNDHDLLLRRAEALLGVPEVLVPAPAANTSLPYPETEVLRHFSIAYGEANGDLRTWRATAGDQSLLRLGAVRRGASSQRIRVPRWAAERANDHAAAWVAALEDSSASVLGDLDHLLVDPQDHPEVDEPPTVVDVASAGRMFEAYFQVGLTSSGSAQGKATPAASPAPPAAPGLAGTPSRDLAAELGRRIRRRMGRVRRPR